MRKTLMGAALLAAVSVAAPAEELMGTLPGTTPFDTNTYSGYLTVSETKQLHYVFAESLSDPENDPVIIWFNGGPGCSSMLAFMQENGPRVIDDGEDFLKENPYPWTERANVIWLESPAGVGWSLAGTDADLDTNDMLQSQDALTALKAWYAKFPEYKTNELFVSGESYGGVYVPYLAWQIYQNNLKSEFQEATESINLGGIMVGNGATTWDFDVNPSFPATVANFNVVPPKLWLEYESEGCYFSFNNVRPVPQTEKCKYLEAKMDLLTSKLNWYDLYRTNYDLTDLKGANRLGKTVIDGEERVYKRGFTQAEYTPFVRNASTLQMAGEGPLLGDYLSDYMNREDVRAAFNLDSSVPTWEMCSETLRYNSQDEASYWIYPILRNKYRLMFYSGDTDGAVTTFGSKEWIDRLNWPTTEAWRPWFTNGQVSGYTESYDGLDFVTVKGVGHMAPQWARQPVTDMITAWVHGERF